MSEHERKEPLQRGTWQRPPRRFPAPWTVEDTGGAFSVKDANGFTICCVYHRDDLQGRTDGDHYMNSNEARRIAAGIARLPELLGARQGS